MALYHDVRLLYVIGHHNIGHVVKDHSDSEENCCHHYIGYSFLLEARILLNVPSQME